MRRARGWHARLVLAEARLRHERWRYGTHDCAQAALASLEALTGLRRSFVVREYDGARQALRLIRCGLRESSTDIAAKLGLVEHSNPRLARKGDPLRVRIERRGRMDCALGFVGTAGVPLVASLGGGLDPVEWSRVDAAWSVP